MGDNFIQNYIAEDGMDIEKNMDRKYFNWMGKNVKRKRIFHEIQKLVKPRLGFFSKLSVYKKSKFSAYKENPWILPIKIFFLQFYGNKNITDRVKLAFEKKEYARRTDLESYLSKYYSGSRKRSDKYGKNLNEEQHFLLAKYVGFYLHCEEPFQERMMDNLNVYCLLVRLKNIKQFVIMSIKKGDLDMETFGRTIRKDTCYTECRDTEELRDYLMFFIEPIRISIKNYEELFIYQTTSILLSYKNKHKRKIRKRNSEKSHVDQKITENQDKNNYDLLVPENLLSTRRRRELRILICLNARNRNTINYNDQKINNSSQVLSKNKDLDRDTKKLMNLKFFLWPNYRFEDLACINRYWFDTHNGSRFSILRIRMYPRLKI